jgi:hypothetical protein
MVGLQTLDLAIGVRVPASQPIMCNKLRAALKSSRPFCVPIVCQPLKASILAEFHSPFALIRRHTTPMLRAHASLKILRLNGSLLDESQYQQDRRLAYAVGHCVP